MKASARIQVTLDVPISDGVWTEHDFLADVRRQAVDAGLQKIGAVLAATGVRMVGEPKVTIVLVEDV